MNKLTKVVGFIIEHRRPLGMIIGGLLSFLGMEVIESGSMV